MRSYYNSVGWPELIPADYVGALGILLPGVDTDSEKGVREVLLVQDSTRRGATVGPETAPILGMSTACREKNTLRLPDTSARHV